MISKSLGNLSAVDVGKNHKHYNKYLLPQEEVWAEYKSIRDSLVVTNKRLIVIDVQGITGKKVECLFLNYSKITAFSVESAGSFDLDSEVNIWLSGMDVVKLAFVKGTGIDKLALVLGEKSLGSQ